MDRLVHVVQRPQAEEESEDKKADGVPDGVVPQERRRDDERRILPAGDLDPTSSEPKVKTTNDMSMVMIVSRVDRAPAMPAHQRGRLVDEPPSRSSIQWVIRENTMKLNRAMNGTIQSADFM